MRSLFVLALLIAALVTTLIGTSAVAGEIEVVAPQANAIQIKLEYYELTPRLTAELIRRMPKAQRPKPDEFQVGVVSGTALEALRKNLVAPEAKITSAPIISTLDNQQATISMTSVYPKAGANGEDISVQNGMIVLPQLNEDKSITLTVTMELPATPASMSAKPRVPSQLSVTAEKRLSPGEVLTFTRAARESGKGLVILVTPTIND